MKTYRVHFPGTSKRPQYGKVVNGKFVKETNKETLERWDYQIKQIYGEAIPKDHVITDRERRYNKAMILGRQMQGYNLPPHLLNEKGKLDMKKYDEALDEHNRRARDEQKRNS